MKLLRDAVIMGEKEDVATVREKFGLVSLGRGISEQPTFVVRRWRNPYNNTPDQRTMLVLVPSDQVDNVWPSPIEQFRNIKYGTASKFRTLRSVTTAIVLHLADGWSLYICLTPAGADLAEEDNFGI